MATESQRWAALNKLTYKNQAIWYLNGYWGSPEPAKVDAAFAEFVWDVCLHFAKLDFESDKKKGANGNELDVFWSAKLLEDKDKSITQISRKEALKAIDSDGTGCMSLIKYLTWKQKRTMVDVVDAPQGDNSAAIAKAQAKVDAALAQLADCEAKLEAQKLAVLENGKAIAELHKQQAALAQAEVELEAAVKDLKAQEVALANKIADLEAKGKAGGVSGARATNELAQLKAEDPLPLRRAKITQEAALRKVKKGQITCEQAKADCERKKIAFEEAVKSLEKAYVDLEKKLGEATAELDDVKSRPGGGKGAIFWMEREMFEADSRLPRSKQRFDHSKDFVFKC